MKYLKIVTENMFGDFEGGWKFNPGWPLVDRQLAQRSES